MDLELELKETLSDITLIDKFLKQISKFRERIKLDDLDAIEVKLKSKLKKLQKQAKTISNELIELAELAADNI